METLTRRRSVLVEKAVIAAGTDKRTYSISFSSEYPADFNGVKEILCHDPGCCDLGRLRAGVVPLLYNHDHNRIIGRVLTGEIDPETRKGRAVIVFSDSEEGRLRQAQFEEDILVNVSFGYSVHQWVPQGEKRVFVTNWEPYEISLVSVPADPQVGKYRAYPGTVEGETVPDSETMTTTATEETRAPAIASDPVVDPREIREKEMLRVRAIMGLGEKWKSRYGEKSTKLADTLISEGISLEHARSKFLDIMDEEPIHPIAGASQDPLGLTKKEQKSYSIIRALQSQITQNFDGAGFEMECSRALAQQLGKPANGFYVPIADLDVTPVRSRGMLQQRAPYQTSVANAAGNLIETVLDTSNFIDMYRNASVFLNLGVRVLGGLQGNVDIPKRLTGSTSYWIAENAAPTESNGTFGLVSLRPKGLGILSSFTRLMTLQSSMDMENLIREDFALTIATEIDKVICNGSGTGGQPRGILNTSGIGSVALGTNGGAPTWDSLIDLETALSVQNALMAMPSYVTNSKGVGALKKIKDTTGAPLWNGPDAGLTPGTPGRVNGYGITFTQNVPGNLTKGTGTNLSAILFGNFRDMFMGTWGPALDIEVNPYSSPEFQAGTFLIRGLLYADLAVARAQSFAAITDAIA
jgi:HK97 family phage major capsid protein/HK97 family phage prohead protease